MKTHLQQRLPVLLLLTLLAVLGNLAAVPLFFGIHLLLGSIAAVLALLLYRGWWGWLIGTLASLYTVSLWGHPWAVVIFSLELAWLSLMLNRWGGSTQTLLKGRIVLADAGYWLLLGAPLVGFFYGQLLRIDPTNVMVTAVKQSFNGIANTIMALVIFQLLHLWSHRHELASGTTSPADVGPPTLPLRGAVLSVVLIATILPALVISLLSSHQLAVNNQTRVLFHLQQLAEASASLEPASPAAAGQIAIGPLPPTMGELAFRRRSADGHSSSSNPELFRRLEEQFSSGGEELIKVPGLELLIPNGKQPILLKWIQGYWSYRQRSDGAEVQVVQPAQSAVMRLQSQSTVQLITLTAVLTAGLALAELISSLGEGQLALIDARLESEVPSEDAPQALISEILTLQECSRQCRLRINSLQSGINQVELDLQQERQQRQELEQHDQLTGALRREQLSDQLSHAILLARREAKPLSWICLQVDDLAQHNQHDGLKGGDHVLCQVADVVRQQIRGSDIIFRMDGSTFGLLLPHRSLQGAQLLAEQLRKTVKKLNGGISLSLGVSDLRQGDHQADELLLRAAQALTEAHRNNGDQVRLR